MNTTNISTEAEQAAYARIRKIGSLGQAICTGMMLFFLVVGVAVFLLIAFGPASAKVSNIRIGPFSIADGSVGSYVGWAKCALLGAVVLCILWIGAGLHIMRRLFRQFAQLQLFDVTTAKLIVWVGLWNLVCLNSLPCILSGMCLLALGKAMELAANLKAEQSLTI